MPILRIVSDSKLSDEQINAVKQFGAMIGYDNPRKIWIEVSDDLTQPDVIYVNVTVVWDDFVNPQFAGFCFHIADYLRGITGKSVEVVRPTMFGIHCVCWCPTEEGAQIYGEGH